MATSAWLEARKKGLGGSDIAALLGVSPWGSALTLWADKTGKTGDSTLDAKEHIEWGNRLEEPITEAYWERTERIQASTPTLDCCWWHELDHWGETKWMYQSREHVWALATPDAFVQEYSPLPWESHADEKFPGKGILEVKNSNAFKRGDWADGPPPYYEIQGQHYLMVTGLQWVSFAVLIGGNELRIFDMPRKDILIDNIIEVGEYFWNNNVVADVPPKASGISAEASLIAELYKEGDGHHVELGPDAQIQLEILRKAEEYITKCDDSMKSAKKAKEAARNNLRMLMGEASSGVAPDGTSLTYKTQHRKGYVVKPSQSRQLRIKRGRKSFA